MKKLITVLFAILILGALHGCGWWDKPDFRQVKWGMSKKEVKKNETAELVKEGEDILTYRLKGAMPDLGGQADEKSGGTPGNITAKENAGEDDESISEPVVTPIHYEYDLLYVFGEGKLGMAVIHLRETLGEPEDYIMLFKEKSASVSKKTGTHAKGIAAYPAGGTPRANPYDSPEDICGGEYVLKHVWPTDRNKTDVSLELDKKKFSPEPDCNLSIFYESVDVEIDPVLRDQLHEVL